VNLGHTYQHHYTQKHKSKQLGLTNTMPSRFFTIDDAS